MKKEQLYKDRVSKTTPVMETTIEGAQKRIEDFIKFWYANADFRSWEKDADLEYIGVFLDTVGDEMAAMSTAHNSLHDRYVQALANRMTYWAAYNEIDQRIYDGTPLFDSREDAQEWLSKQVNVRPSTRITQLKVELQNR